MTEMLFHGEAVIEPLEAIAIRAIGFQIQKRLQARGKESLDRCHRISEKIAGVLAEEKDIMLDEVIAALVFFAAINIDVAEKHGPEILKEIRESN